MIAWHCLSWEKREKADQRRFSLPTCIDIYFCDPKRPWQRGSNENINALLSQTVFSQGD